MARVNKRVTLAHVFRLTAAVAALCAAGAGPAAAGRTFPSLSGRTLLGEQETVPRDFTGRPALIFVAFARAQQDQIVSWLPFVRSVTASARAVPVVQIPVLPRYAKTFGTFIEARFRSTIASDAARHATLVVYRDPADVARELGLHDTGDAAVVVLDPRGDIAWLGHGAYDDVVAGDVRRALDAASQP